MGPENAVIGDLKTFGEGANAAEVGDRPVENEWAYCTTDGLAGDFGGNAELNTFDKFKLGEDEKLWNGAFSIDTDRAASICD